MDVDLRGVRLGAAGLLMAAFGAAHAGPVYKCKNEKGETVFTDKKCAFETKQERVWDSNLGGTSYPETMSGLSPGLAGVADDGVPQVEVRSRRHQSGGYACSTSQRSWVQDAPCPRTVRDPHSTVIRHRDGTWTQVNSTYSAAVGEDPLTHDQLCAALARPSKPHESAYDRNKMKREAGCP